MTDDELENLITENFSAHRYLDAARLAAHLDDVISRESWFEQIALAHETDYIEQMEFEETNTNQCRSRRYNQASHRRASAQRRRLYLIQEKRIYEHVHAER